MICLRHVMEQEGQVGVSRDVVSGIGKREICLPL